MHKYKNLSIKSFKNLVKNIASFCSKMASHKSVVLITGGCGYVGSYLAKELVLQNYLVVLFDISPPQETSINIGEGISFIEGDICDLEQMSSALKQSKAESVIHCAGFGLSSTSNLPAFNDLTTRVNVFGTQVVVDACLLNQVKNLVLTSSVNVAFSGDEIFNGDEESHKWLDESKVNHCDVYSSSKQESEKIVYKANGKQNRNGGKLKTTILRLAGVYGPGEQIILGRSLNIIKNKFTKDVFVQREGLLLDFVHIKNVVQAHVKAIQTLEQETSADGQIFYVTDDNPTNMNFFLDPMYSLLTGESARFPDSKIIFPIILVHLLAGIFSLLSIIFGKRISVPYWGFTPMETYKVSTTHYFSIEKARKILNYNPEPCSAKDWEVIKGSLQHMTNQKSTSWTSGDIYNVLKLLMGYSVIVLRTIYLYVAFFASVISTGL